MALIEVSNQYRFSGRGPFDAKALVKTFADLLKTETWDAVNASGNKVSSAYNGMIVAVWANTVDSSKNGVYFLHDPQVTSPLKSPDVTVEANWHKVAEVSELKEFVAKLSVIETELLALEARVTAIEEDSDVITYGYKSGFPKTGEANKLYVAADEGKSYIWFNNDYMPVGGDSEPAIIYGGSAK